MRRQRFAMASQVFDAFPIAREDIEAEPADIEPFAFLDKLMQGPTPEDAIGFCAYLLPRREAVQWACQCIRAIESPVRSADQDVLELAEAWVKDPHEENRQAALSAGLKAKVKSAAALAALGAAWSGGNMLEDPERPVPPPAYLTAQAVRAAVLTTLAQAGTKERRQHLAACVQRAVKLMSMDDAAV
jgi:hypothetical protein